MNRTSFVSETIMKLNDASFELTKNMLKQQGMYFSAVSDEEISRSILSEKICDYLRFVEVKNRKQFDQILQNYFDVLSLIVERKLVPEPKHNKKQPVVPASRARKYYDKAVSFSKQKPMTVEAIVDCSRIMLCLYMAIINKNHNPIDDFDFALECIKPGAIVKSILTETGKGLNAKSLLDTKDVFSQDRCVLDILVIVCGLLLNDTFEKEET